MTTWFEYKNQLVESFWCESLEKKMDDSKENYYSLLYVGFNINFFASGNLWQPHEQNAWLMIALTQKHVP